MSRDLKRIGLLFVFVLSIGGLAGCGGEDEECLDDAVCGTNIETCCTSSECHYTVEGRRYNCNGTNCDSAAVQAVNAACGANPSDAQARALIKAAADAVESRRVAP